MRERRWSREPTEEDDEACLPQHRSTSSSKLVLLLDCFLYSAPTSQPCLVTRIDVPAPLASSSSASRSRAPMKVNLAASTSCSSLRRRHSFRSAVQPGGSSVRAVRGRLDARSACHLRPALSRLVPVLLLEWTSHRLRSCSQAGPAGAVRLTGCHGAHVLGPASPALRRFGSCSVSPVDILREAACRAASYTVRPTRRSCARGSPSDRACTALQRRGPGSRASPGAAFPLFAVRGGVASPS